MVGSIGLWRYFFFHYRAYISSIISKDLEYIIQESILVLIVFHCGINVREYTGLPKILANWIDENFTF